MFSLICLLLLTAVAGEDDSITELFGQANSQFSANMLSEIAGNNPGKSIVISAYSTLPPLAMLSLASVGNTHDEILKVIGLPNDNVTKEVFSAVCKELRSPSGIDLKTANRIYIADGNALNKDFVDIFKDVFDSELKTANFVKKQETADEINAWVEEQTNHRIKNLADPDSFSEDTQAVLVNAIYFKGSWLHKFDKKYTAYKKFHVTREKTIKLPSMYRTGTFLYGESTELDAKVLELPYDLYDASLYIFLPNKIDGITNLVHKIKDSSAISRAIDNMDETKVDVTIPKFKIATTIDLKKILMKMGVEDIFDSSKARIDKLLVNPADLYVSEAIQKAVIEINEEGAEAAAATQYVSNTRSFKANCATSFTVDRPFLFVLKYNMIDLFSGVFSA